MVTYRADAVVGDSPLRSWLAELARLPRVTRMALDRLGVASQATEMSLSVHDPRSGDEAMTARSRPRRASS